MPESKTQSIITRISSSPRISNFFRSVLEAGFSETKKTIKRELNCHKKTLDIGCGPGFFSILFDDYIGIDISVKFIKYAQKKYQREFYIMDATDIKFRDDSFDNVLVVGLLHHLDDKICLKVISEIKRVLNKNGQALILEDIPAQSRFNIIGRLAHKFDLGSHIREMSDYQKLLEQELSFSKSYKIRNGIADYGVFVVRKN